MEPRWRTTHPLVICPYDKSHTILESRIQMHLIKCARSHPGVMLEVCPHNASHRFRDYDKYEQHVKICPNQRLPGKVKLALEEKYLKGGCIEKISSLTTRLLDERANEDWERPHDGKTEIAQWQNIPKSTLFTILEMREETVNAGQKEDLNIKTNNLKGATHVNLEQTMLQIHTMMQRKTDELAPRPMLIANCFRHAHFVLPVNEKAAVRVFPTAASANDPDDPLPVDASFQPGPLHGTAGGPLHGTAAWLHNSTFVSPPEFPSAVRRGNVAEISRRLHV
uniref:(California timema) hypothetical protein n=1 Tax=Timema californicum TaxID=61474 RepID=A0A7R9P9D2_TIMCA|nr:unnamed protein product [Timema californicum]